MSHKCEKCGKEFDSERGLHIHQSQKHSDEEETESNESEITETTQRTQNGITLTTKQFGIAALIFGIALGFTGGLYLDPVTNAIQNNAEAANPDQGDSSPQQISGSPEEVMQKIAGEIGANSSRLASCMDSSNGSEAIRDRKEAADTLGKVGTPTFLIGNSDIGFEKARGAQPISSMGPIIEEQLSEANSGETSIEDDELRLDNMTIENEPSKGESNASVKIVEVSDFACPWCAEWAGYDAIPSRNIDERNAWGKMKDNYISTGDVEFVYKDYPAHRNSATAHEAANCIQKQGDELYWKFHDKLFEYRNSWTA